MEHQEPAERKTRELEQIPGNGGHRFWCVGWSAGAVCPCDRALAGGRQSRNIFGTPDQSQRNVQRKYMPPRFMVDREAMAEPTHQCTRRSVRGSRFLRSPALRSVLHLRADGLRVGQFIYDPRVLRSSLDAGDGSPRRTHTQPLCEIDGTGCGPLAFLAKPDRPGPAVQWNSSECFGDRVHTG
jgi:hypothetical protein